MDNIIRHKNRILSLFILLVYSLLSIQWFNPRELYWVGDGGNWSDTAHWSLASGGAGGEHEPRKYDDVIIDYNSFTKSQDYRIYFDYGCSNN